MKRVPGIFSDYLVIWNVSCAYHLDTFMNTDLKLLSVVIPARDEAPCIAKAVENLHLELDLNRVPHEIVVVDDGSIDRTWNILEDLSRENPSLHLIRNDGVRGFGAAVIKGIDFARGDAVVIMTADESDDPRDVVRYWKLLVQGWDCVFGSRFIEGGIAIGYPWLRLIKNRLGNLVLRKAIGIKFNDTTNPFKAYRKTAIDGCRPFMSPHFDFTVELPLKAILRGFSCAVIPVTWCKRRTGKDKHKVRKMRSHYRHILHYVWLEKYFGRYNRRKLPEAKASADEPLNSASQETQSIQS